MATTKKQIEHTNIARGVFSGEESSGVQAQFTPDGYFYNMLNMRAKQGRVEKVKGKVDLYPLCMAARANAMETTINARRLNNQYTFVNHNLTEWITAFNGIDQTQFLQSQATAPYAFVAGTKFTSNTLTPTDEATLITALRRLKWKITNTTSMINPVTLFQPNALTIVSCWPTGFSGTNGTNFALPNNGYGGVLTSVVANDQASWTTDMGHSGTIPDIFHPFAGSMPYNTKISTWSYYNTYSNGAVACQDGLAIYSLSYYTCQELTDFNFNCEI